MPTVIVTIQDSKQAVFRPVILGVVEELKRYIGLDKNTQVFLPLDAQAVASRGSTIDPNNGNDPLFASTKQLRIEVDEDIDVQDVARRPAPHNTEPAFVIDQVRGIDMSARYVSTDLLIKVKYSTHSEAEAFRWRDEMRLRVAQLHDQCVHDLQYHIPVPNSLVTLLENVYLLKEKTAPDSESLSGYLRRICNPRLTVITDLAGQSVTFALREVQSGVRGMFDFSPVPQPPQKNSSDGTWGIEFGYKLNYKRAVSIQARYPVMVHQSLMPAIYTDHIQKAIEEDHRRTYPDAYTSVAEAGLMSFDSYRRNIFLAKTQPVYVPMYDNEIIDLPKGQVVICRVLCSLNPQDTQDLFNLKHIPDVMLDPDILEYLSTADLPYLSSPYRSFYGLVLHENSSNQDPTALEVDSDLNVRSVAPLDLTKIYRVSFYLDTRINLIYPAAFERLAQHPKALAKTLAALNEWFTPFMISGNTPIFDRFTRVELNILYWLLTGKTLDKTPLVGVSDDPQIHLAKYLDQKSVRPDFLNATTAAMGARLNYTRAEVSEKYGSFYPQLLERYRRYAWQHLTVARTAVISTKFMTEKPLSLYNN